MSHSLLSLPCRNPSIPSAVEGRVVLGRMRPSTALGVDGGDCMIGVAGCIGPMIEGVGA